MQEMTHFLSICNGFTLFVRYNEEENVIEYNYSDESEIKSTPLLYNEEGIPYFSIEGEDYDLDDFCPIQI